MVYMRNDGKIVHTKSLSERKQLSDLKAMQSIKTIRKGEFIGRKKL